MVCCLFIKVRYFSNLKVLKICRRNGIIKIVLRGSFLNILFRFFRDRGLNVMKNLSIFFSIFLGL